jgi:8-oxo-dGTP diphosphatase
MVFGASGLILKENKILLVKRSSNANTFPNTWTCPGGRSKEGESPQQTAARELKEEVNLDFKPRMLFKKGKHKGSELFRFLGDWSGDVKIQEEELSDYNWFSYIDAIKLDLGFDYREIIEMLHLQKLI